MSFSSSDALQPNRTLLAAIPDEFGGGAIFIVEDEQALVAMNDKKPQGIKMPLSAADEALDISPEKFALSLMSSLQYAPHAFEIMTMIRAYSAYRQAPRYPKADNVTLVYDHQLFFHVIDGLGVRVYLSPLAILAIPDRYVGSEHFEAALYEDNDYVMENDDPLALMIREHINKTIEEHGEAA